jgi:hypothetical protein
LKLLLDNDVTVDDILNLISSLNKGMHTFFFDAIDDVLGETEMEVQPAVLLVHFGWCCNAETGFCCK